MNPSQLYQALLAYETDGSNEPDARRVISAERQLLHVVMEGKDSERIAAVAKEAERVARMWGALKG